MTAADAAGEPMAAADAGGEPMAAAAVEARLRPLAVGDLTRVADLERELFGASAWSPAMLAEELRGPDRCYVAAVIGGPDAGPSALVGYAGLWFDGDDATVMTIGVAREHQGRRIGRQLMAALVARARELDARSVLLEVRVDNEPALALYERFGFVRLGRRRGYYQPENADAWTMRLDLAAGGSEASTGGSTGRSTGAVGGAAHA
jgi:ribosomal-protein-alanine N-acetyltransferase